MKLNSLISLGLVCGMMSLPLAARPSKSAKKTGGSPQTVQTLPAFSPTGPYAAEMKAMLAAIPAQRQREVQSLNEQLQRVLAPGDFLDILSGEWAFDSTAYYNEGKTLTGTLRNILEHPDNENIYSRPHFVRTVPQGIHFSDSLTLPRQVDYAYVDDDYIVERNKGNSSSRYIFWNARTGKQDAVYYLPSEYNTVHGRLDTEKKVYAFTYNNCEGGDSYWAGNILAYAFAEPSTGESLNVLLPHNKGTNPLASFIANRYGVPALKTDIAKQENVITRAKTIPSVWPTGLTELGLPDYKVDKLGNPQEDTYAYNNAHEFVTAEAEQNGTDYLVYSNAAIPHMEVFLNLTDLTTEYRARKITLREKGDEALRCTEQPFYQKVAPLLQTTWLQEDNLDGLELGNGYTWFSQGEVQNDWLAGVRGLVFPDRSVWLFPIEGKEGAISVTAGQMYEYNSCIEMQNGFPDMNEKVRIEMTPWYRPFYCYSKLSDDGRQMDLVEHYGHRVTWLKIDTQKHTYRCVKHWAVGDNQRPCVWLDKLQILLLSQDKNTYSILRVREQGEDEVIGKLILANGAGYAIVLPDGTYAGSPGCESFLSMGINGKEVDMNIFAPWRNRPDKVLEALGGNPDDVAALRETTRRWLNTQKMDLEQMPEEPNPENLPKVAVDMPPLYAKSAQISFPVSVSAAEEPVTALKVLVDGTPMPTDTEIKVEAGQTHTVSVPVHLAHGQNWIEVTPIDVKGRVGETVRFRSIYSSAEPSALYVVALGVSNYTKDELKLKYAAKDAHDVAKAFKQFSPGKTQVLCLTDKEVTRANIQGKVKEFLAAATENDGLVFYVAGHGFLDERLDYYYAPVDVDDERPAETGISMSELQEVVLSAKARKRLMLLDTCHSGAVGEADMDKLAASGVELPKGVRALPLTRGMKVKRAAAALNANQKKRYMEEFFSRSATTRGINLVAGAAGAEYALESSEWNNGVFTSCIIKALKGSLAADTNGDGTLSGEELQHYISTEVSNMTNGAQRPGVSVSEDISSLVLGINMAKAVADGNWERVRSLAASGCSADDKGAGANGLIAMAIRKKAPYSILKLLMDCGADPDCIENLYNECEDAPRFMRDAMQHHLSLSAAKHILSFYCNDAATAKLLVEYGVDPKNPTILYDNNSPEVCEYLLACGANPNQYMTIGENQGYAPIHSVRYNSSPEKLQVLIRHGGNVNLKVKELKIGSDADSTLLHMACNATIARTLLENGADIEARNAAGRTPLQECLYRSGYSFRNEDDARLLISSLISAGADIEATDNEGDTALHYAAGSNHSYWKALTSILLQAGANTEARNNHGKTARDITFDKAAFDSLVACAGGSRASGSSADAASFLPSVNSYSNSGTNALYKKRLNMLLPMIANGAPVDITTVETKGNTALHYACGLGHVELIRWLVAHGANVNARTDKGATPTQCCSSAAARTALQGGASVSPAPQSYTPSYGGGSTNSDAASFLPSVNSYSDSGTNALYKKRLNMLLPMIANGAPVDITTVETKGNTALHYACGLGHVELVRWLLQNGANPNAVTNKGATPLQCSGNSSVSNLLRQYGAR